MDGVLIFLRGRKYNTKHPNEYEMNNGVAMLVESEYNKIIPLSKIQSNLHFQGIEENRNNTINEILK